MGRSAVNPEMLEIEIGFDVPRGRRIPVTLRGRNRDKFGVDGPGVDVVMPG